MKSAARFMNDESTYDVCFFATFSVAHRRTAA
jgi:hypothetical protein